MRLGVVILGSPRSGKRVIAHKLHDLGIKMTKERNVQNRYMNGTKIH